MVSQLTIVDTVFCPELLFLLFVFGPLAHFALLSTWALSPFGFVLLFVTLIVFFFVNFEFYLVLISLLVLFYFVLILSFNFNFRFEIFAGLLV